MFKYQKDFAHQWPEMYDRRVRESKVSKIVKVLEDYYGVAELKKLSLLDIGGSSGIMDNVLAQKCKRVVGVDIDEKAIEFAGKNFRRKNLKFQVDDAMNLSFRNNTFDIVVCAQVYEHVPDSKLLFKEIYRVLKPRGVCYLAAINRLWPWEPHYRLLFLAWLPKRIANIYLRIARGIPEYYEKLETPWVLTRLTKKFVKVDYTAKILANPRKFGHKNLFPKIIGSAVKILSPILKYVAPSSIWILVKPASKK